MTPAFRAALAQARALGWVVNPGTPISLPGAYREIGPRGPRGGMPCESLSWSPAGVWYTRDELGGPEVTWDAGLVRRVNGRVSWRRAAEILAQPLQMKV